MSKLKIGDRVEVPTKSGTGVIEAVNICSVRSDSGGLNYFEEEEITLSLTCSERRWAMRIKRKNGGILHNIWWVLWDCPYWVRIPVVRGMCMVLGHQPYDEHPTDAKYRQCLWCEKSMPYAELW